MQEGADGEAGPSNGGRKRQRGTGTSARAQLPTLVLSSKQPGTRATARSKAPGPSIITPKSFQLFLNHLYDWDAEIASVRPACWLAAYLTQQCLVWCLPASRSSSLLAHTGSPNHTPAGGGRH